MTSQGKGSILLAVLALLTALLSASAAFATPIASVPSWEVASEFNDVSNPSGVWSYCEKASVNNITCTLASAWADPNNPNDVKGWADTSTGVTIAHNVNPVPFTNNTYTYPITVPAHALLMHPGSAGEYAVVRFTAPAKGKYRLSGQFYALDGTNFGPNTYWDTTDVEIVKNITTTVFASNLDYLNGPKWTSFTTTPVVLNRGDTIDFQVGYGNGNYYFDSTGLNAVIEKIK